MRGGGREGGTGGVCSLANYNVAYKDTQSNRVSDFRDFVCSLFPKAILLDLYVYICTADHISYSSAACVT